MFSKIKDYLSLCRSDVRAITFMAALAGYLLAYDTIDSTAVIKALFISLFLYNFVYVFNSITDIKEDKINKPERALPSGRIKKKHAYIYLLFLTIGSLVGIPILFSGISIVFAYMVLLIGFLYSAHPFEIKKIPILASFITGWGIAHPLLITGGMKIFIYFAAFTFLASGVTILKDLSDIEGDRAAGRKVITDLMSFRSIFIISALSIITSIVIFVQLDNLPLLLTPFSCLSVVFYYLFFKKPEEATGVIYRNIIRGVIVSLIIAGVMVYFSV